MKLFSKIAYHSTDKELTKFSNMTTKGQSYSGEGQMVHGYGLYLQEDKELNDKYYKSMYAKTDIIVTVGNKNYYGTKPRYMGGNLTTEYQYWHCTWYDDKSELKKDYYGKTQLLDYLSNIPIDIIEDIYEQWLENLSSDEISTYRNKSSISQDVKNTTKLLNLIKDWKSQGVTVKDEYKHHGIQYTVEIPDEMNIIEEKELIDLRFSVDDVAVGLENLLIESFKNNPWNSERLQDDIWKELHDNPVKFIKLYWVLNGRMRNDKELTKKLIDIGIDGMSYDGGRDGHCYVIYNCKKLKIIGRE